MCDEPYIIIHTGDPYEFVIKNVNEPETYGTFHGDKYDQKSMKKFIEKVNRIVKENEQLKQFQEKVFKLIDNNIKIYEDTTTNDEFLQIQLDTKLQTLYNLRKELLKK